LKAYLTARERPFGRTHSLVALVAQCSELDPAFEGLRQAATTLTPYAVTLRYPGDMPDVSHVEAVEALQLAEQVIDAVEQALAARQERGDDRSN
jgi:HEPN domain-containing protein